MTTTRPQYFEIGLRVVKLEKETLERALLELREAVRKGLAMVPTRSQVPDPNDTHAFGTIYNGDLGKLGPLLSTETMGS